jgi:hypothetical protein
MPEETELTAAELGYEPDGLNTEPVPGFEDEGAAEATEDSVEAEPAQEGQETPEADTQEPGGADAGDEQGSEGAESTAAVPEKSQESTEGSVETGFTFRGKQYATQEEAEQEIGSWEGRLSASDRRNHEYYAYVQEVKAQNERLNAELEGLKQKSDQGKEVPEKEPEKPKSFAESLDWEALQRVKEYAESKGYDPTMVTMRAIAEHFDKHVGSAIEDKLSGINATLEEKKAADDWNRVENEVFDWASDAKNPDGNLAFPELNKESGEFSEEFVRLMYSTWNDLARDNPAFGITPQAVDYAYRLTRDLATQLMEEEQAKAKVEPGAAPDKEGEELRKARNADAETVGGTGAHGGANPLGKPAPRDGSDLLKEWEDIKHVEVDGHNLGYT